MCVDSCCLGGGRDAEELPEGFIEIRQMVARFCGEVFRLFSDARPRGECFRVDFLSREKWEVVRKLF